MVYGSNIPQLVQRSLQEAHVQVMPDLQQQLTAALSTLLTTNTTTTTAQQMVAFSATALDGLRNNLLQELSQSLSAASLAAISELSASNQMQQARRANQAVDNRVLEGLSESDNETTTSERDRALPGAPMGEPTPEGAPAGSALPLTEGGMPATKPGAATGTPAVNPHDLRKAQRQDAQAQSLAETGQSTNAMGEPEIPVQDQNMAATAAAEEDGAVPEETAEQYKSRSISNALQAEQQRRSAMGQVAMTDQSQSHYKLGLGLVADEGAKVGQKLKDNIKTGSFTSFTICMVIALTKDILEPIAWYYFDPGFTGTVLSIFLGGILTTLLLSEGVWFRRWLIKKFLGKAMIAFIASLIPGVNVVFPEYTVGVALMGYDNFKAIQRLTKTLMSHEAMMKKISKMIRSAPKVNQNTIRKLKKQLQAHRQIADE